MCACKLIECNFILNQPVYKTKENFQILEANNKHLQFANILIPQFLLYV